MRLAARRVAHARVNPRVFTVIPMNKMHTFEAAHLRVKTTPLVAQLHDSSDGFFATTGTVSSIDWPATSATGTPDSFWRISFEAPGVPACLLFQVWMRTKVKLSLYDGLDKHWGKRQNRSGAMQK